MGFAQGLPFAGGEAWPRKDLALYCEIEGLCTLANKAHASALEILCHFMLAAFQRGRLGEETRLGKRGSCPQRPVWLGRRWPRRLAVPSIR